MDDAAQHWFDTRTSRAEDWQIPPLLQAKRTAGETVSVVIPARNEQASVGDVVTRIVRDLVPIGLVDEVVVMDSLSRDATAEVARAAGATVHGVADVRPDLGVRSGKGEALWKSLFVTSGSLLVFIDADLTEWGTHFVTGLLGPMLSDPGVALARGFYDRVLAETGQVRTTEGGRVTELMARPLLATRWPQLSAFVQPLAGEWAIRRDWFEQLHVPGGYGVEFSTLIDTYTRRGLEAIAQVDLGARAHKHQHVHDLSAMALEILSVADRRDPAWGADRRSGRAHGATSAEIHHFDRDAPDGWQHREVWVGERPPAASVMPR